MSMNTLDRVMFEHIEECGGWEGWWDPYDIQKVRTIYQLAQNVGINTIFERFAPEITYDLLPEKIEPNQLES